MQNLADLAVNTFTLILALAVIRHWMKKLEEKIDLAVSDTTCLERKAALSEKVDAVETVNVEQWAVINHHGHKGLDGDNNLVVRPA